MYPEDVFVVVAVEKFATRHSPGFLQGELVRKKGKKISQFQYGRCWSRVNKESAGTAERRGTPGPPDRAEHPGK